MYSDRSAYHLFTDVELTKLLVSGDHKAFIEIYNRFQALLYVYACKITKDREEAEDIVQEVFIYLWDKRSTIILKSNISSYLYSAVRYKFFNLLDHKKIRTDYTKSFQNFLDAGEYITDNYIREKEFSQLIEKEISALPDKMREIFELSRRQNLSRQEIAEKLNISEKTVKNQISNALKILRGKLGFFPFLFLLLNK
jgi:RNA polymerase sigma-70 factor (ECF subfamily)